MNEQYERVAIVTGATSGIGEATARLFVASGFGVVGIGRNAEKLAEQERELGQAFVGVAGDASDESMIGCLFAIAIERLGQEADIVVANAGRGLGGSVKDADLSEFREVFEINVQGALLLLQQAARRMVVLQEGRFPRKAADIVVFGSTVGYHISPFSAVYGSTKFAVHSLAEGLRR
jgi:NADP-dependent 3-hydroxy acid dehydrogenase YdfG